MPSYRVAAGTNKRIERERDAEGKKVEVGRLARLPIPLAQHTRRSYRRPACLGGLNSYPLFDVLS